MVLYPCPPTQTKMERERGKRNEEKMMIESVSSTRRACVSLVMMSEALEPSAAIRTFEAVSTI